MKTTLLPMMVTLALFSSSALADSFGLRLGIPAGVQYTQDNAFGRNRDLRIAGGIVPIGGILGEGLILDADVDYIIGSGSNGVEFYYGGGASLGFAAVTGAGVVFPGLHGLAGVEYHLDKSLSIFVDASLGFNYYFGGIAGLGVAGGFLPGAGGAVGLKFRL